MRQQEETLKNNQNFISILRPYWTLIFGLVALTLVSSGLTLWLPLLLSEGIDHFLRGESVNIVVWKFGAAAGVIFLLNAGQNIVQTYASERVARDLRHRLAEKISTKSFADIQVLTPAKLLTHLTADVDAIKNFVAQAIVHVISSGVLIVGGSVLLLTIHWQLGLVVLTILPIIGGTFFIILGKVRTLFVKTREVIDWLNKVINESILGAALVRVLHAQNVEERKFAEANAQARNVGQEILKLFSAMIPIVTFVANLAVLMILVLGGRYIILGSMSLGEFASFNSYLTMLIFPIFILGFVSNIVAQAQASYGRIAPILFAESLPDEGSLTTALQGNIHVDHASLSFGEKIVLKDIVLDIRAGSKTAIIGPTAAGKTQLMNLLVGVMEPTSGVIQYDHQNIQKYRKAHFYAQVGIVFQDSSIFHMSVRENIAFHTEVTKEAMQKAIDTAELRDFIETLPDGLDTVVSERGTSLSGGQKQRLMLARALAIEPKILLLDDFTARIDADTEGKILANLAKNYPGITIVSITQKISSIEQYDQIVVLTDGEIIARGTHENLLEKSPEYAQIYYSQQSMNTL